MGDTRPTRRTMTGTVVSTRRAKTITVLVTSLVEHAKYGKYVRRRKKYHAHDESGQAALGDEVELVETRPLSLTKRWRLARVVRRGGGLEQVAPVELEAGVSEALGRKS